MFDRIKKTWKIFRKKESGLEKVCRFMNMESAFEATRQHMEGSLRIQQEKRQELINAMVKKYEITEKQANQLLNAAGNTLPDLEDMHKYWTEEFGSTIIDDGSS